MTNKKKTVLVVEDDMLLLNLLSDRFEEEKYRVLRASDGEEALRMLFDEKPDVILLDLLLPKLDGFEFLEKIKKSANPEVERSKVIVLSNLWENEYIIKAKAYLQVEEYLVKANTTVEQIISKVKQQLA